MLNSVQHVADAAVYRLAQAMVLNQRTGWLKMDRRGFQ